MLLRIGRFFFYVEGKERFLIVVENFTGEMVFDFVIIFLMSRRFFVRFLLVNKFRRNSMSVFRLIE